jgi:large exoprotein involved in heme utilization and adhesion
MSEIGNASHIKLETHSKDENAGETGKLNIEADSLFFHNGAYIANLTFGHGKCNDITIKINEEFNLTGMNKDSFARWIFKTFFAADREISQGGIFNSVLPTSNGGNGGNIKINAGKMSILDSNQIVSTTFGFGKSGDISINCEKTLLLEGSFDTDYWSSCIASSSLPLRTIGGDAGNIELTAGELILREGAYISTTTDSLFGIKSGNAGNITLKVFGPIIIDGVNPYGDTIGSNAVSAIGSDTISNSNNAGQAGNIFIESKSIDIINGGIITVKTFGNSNSGNIDIKVSDYINIHNNSNNLPFIEREGLLPNKSRIVNSGIFASSQSILPDSGKGGNINVSAKSLSLSKKGTISTLSMGGGDAGNINLNISSLYMYDQAAILSSSKSPSHGGSTGQINICANRSINLKNKSLLSTEAVNTVKETINHEELYLNGKITLTLDNSLYLLNSSITSSVKGGTGKGGDIDINQSKYTLLNKSNIIANAYEGSGGNINIDSDYLIQSTDSKIWHPSFSS